MNPRLPSPLLALCLTVAIRPALAAQGPPGGDIFVISLEKSGDRLTLGRAVPLVSRPGYDNQPFFSPDGKLLYYTSIREGGRDGSTQADIFRVDLATGKIAPFCETPQSEYSPTVHPNGRELVVVRVERDSSQRLWAFPLGGGEPRLVAPDLEPVGYQAWFDSLTVGTFVLDEPPTLRITDLATQKSTTVLSNIGRSVVAVPGKRAIAVAAQLADSSWWVMEIDRDGRSQKIIELHDGSDFFTWGSDGAVYTGHGRSIFRFQPGRDKSWTFLGDIKVDGFGDVSRLALSPDGKRLAVVLAEINP